MTPRLYSWKSERSPPNNMCRRTSYVSSPTKGGAADWSYGHYGTIAALRTLQLERMADQSKVGKEEDEGREDNQKADEKAHENKKKSRKKSKLDSQPK